MVDIKEEDIIHWADWRDAMRRTTSLYDTIICPKEAIHKEKVLEALGTEFECFVVSYDRDGKELSRFYCGYATDADRAVFDRQAEYFEESEAFKETMEQLNDPYCLDGIPASVMYQHTDIDHPNGRSGFFERIAIAVPEAIGSNVALFLLFRVNRKFTEADHIGCAYTRTLFALLETMLRAQKSEALSDSSMNDVLRSMTYYEIMVMKEILNAVEGDEGVFIGVNIAKSLGCSRSIAVQAIKKMSIAGIIEASSLGMRGTRIKILKPSIREHIKQYV